nr:MAG TPA: hypothetical protein [Caudoviricetes sp.]
MGLIILTLLGLKYLPGWVKLVWLFHQVLNHFFSLCKAVLFSTNKYGFISF